MQRRNSLTLRPHTAVAHLRAPVFALACIYYRGATVFNSLLSPSMASNFISISMLADGAGYQAPPAPHAMAPALYPRRIAGDIRHGTGRLPKSQSSLPLPCYFASKTIKELHYT